ncbi:MAG: EscN/YscN/HrcN family type secretion system ATPase [Pseudomonadota bacterium]|jgi:type III secretion protein N (ATPase)
MDLLNPGAPAGLSTADIDGHLRQTLLTLQKARTVSQRGRVVQAFGTMLRVSGIHARIGQQCHIVDPDTGSTIGAEVVGFSDGHTLLVPLAPLHGVALNSEVEVLNQGSSVLFGDGLKGRVLNSFGQPIDGKPLPAGLVPQPLHAEAPGALSRPPIDETFATGVRAIDGLLTVGVGQRLGVFAAAGGGKSTLLGMLAKQAQADVTVIALIGERGREVREFIEDSLGEDGMAKSVLVVSTSDRPAMERVRAAHAATAIAEGFRAQGARVLLLMDSVTRYARALREIGLSIGEPPVRRGFPPSVFAELPRLFERVGNDGVGSITAFYTVLLEDEDSADPVAEEVRSILDGHLVLSRQLGQANHYPAIDVLGSVSRTFTRVASPAHRQAAGHVRALMAKHAEIKFLLQVGEYRAGSDPLADEAIAKQAAINALLRQQSDETSALTTTLDQLGALAT